MPTFEYQCHAGHVSERVRKIADRHLSVACHCGRGAELIISHGHVPPSGMYSYMPNLGNARDFDRRQSALESGQRIIKREAND